MSAPARKRLLEALESKDWPFALRSIGEEVSRGLISQAVAALCSKESETRWRAVEAVGYLVCRFAQENPEAAKDVIRRLLWSLNEESGSIGWGAPEALAEILARDRESAKEFLPIFASFLKARELERMPPTIAQGFLWGVFRLGELHSDVLGSPEVIEGLKASLGSPHPSTRGLAILALKRLGVLQSLPGLESLLNDQEVFTFMEEGRLHQTSISKAARP